MRYTLVPIALSLSIMQACTSSPTPQPASQGRMIDGLFSQPQWQQLQRVQPRYPMREAMKGNSGCATVQYQVSPNYQLTDIEVVQASSKHFAKAAKTAVKKWDFSQVPSGLITEPVFSQTRIEFCAGKQPGDCDKQRLSANDQCSGNDLLFSIGYLIKR